MITDPEINLDDLLSFRTESGETNTSLIIREIVHSYFPNLNEKEILVCGFIILAHHDLGHGCYSNIIQTLANNFKIFADADEVEDTINQVLQKGIAMKEPYDSCNLSPYSLSLAHGSTQDKITEECLERIAEDTRRIVAEIGGYTEHE